MQTTWIKLLRRVVHTKISRNVSVNLSEIFVQFWEGVQGPFSLGKLAWQAPKLGDLLQCTIMSKIPIYQNKFG